MMKSSKRNEVSDLHENLKIAVPTLCVSKKKSLGGGGLTISPLDEFDCRLGSSATYISRQDLSDFYINKKFFD